MMRYVSGFLGVVALLLLFSSVHYRALSNQLQSRVTVQQKTITDTEQANQSLMTTAASLNSRNNNLVEALNDRSDKLAAETRRANANKQAYQRAISANHSWASEPVPGSVARILYSATHASVQNNNSPKDSSSK